MSSNKKIYIYQRWGIGDCLMSNDAVKLLKILYKESDTIFIVASEFVGKSLVEIGIANSYRTISKKSLFIFLMDFIKLDINSGDILLLPIKTHPILLLMFKFLFPNLLILSRGFRQMNRDYSRPLSDSRYLINLDIVKKHFSLDQKECLSYIDNSTGAGKVHNIVYHLGSGSQPIKRIPTSVIKKIHRKLIEDGPDDCKYYILVGPDDFTGDLKDLNNSYPEITIFYSTTLSDLVSLLECSLVITGDTGVAHIASYINGKALVLGGPTNTIESAPLKGTKVFQDSSLCEFAPCYGTKRFSSCPYGAKCMVNMDHNTIVNMIQSYKTSDGI
jgi:ADP-heptose:LPS heptosyltransferase